MTASSTISPVRHGPSVMHGAVSSRFSAVSPLLAGASSQSGLTHKAIVPRNRKNPLNHVRSSHAKCDGKGRSCRGATSMRPSTWSTVNPRCCPRYSHRSNSVLGVAGEGIPSHRPARDVTRYVIPRTVATSLIPASPSGSIPWTIGADSASFTGPLATTSRRSNAPPAAAALLWPCRLIRLSLHGDHGFAVVGALTNWLISLMRARSSTGLVRDEETPRLWAILRGFSPARGGSTLIRGVFGS